MVNTSYFHLTTNNALRATAATQAGVTWFVCPPQNPAGRIRGGVKRVRKSVQAARTLPTGNSRPSKELRKTSVGQQYPVVRKQNGRHFIAGTGARSLREGQLPDGPERDIENEYRLPGGKRSTSTSTRMKVNPTTWTRDGTPGHWETSRTLPGQDRPRQNA